MAVPSARTLRHPSPLPPAAHRPGAPASVWLARVAVAAAFVGLIFLALGVMAAAAFDLNYRGRIYPGVHAWGLDLSGQKPEEAALALSAAFSYPQSQAFVFKDPETGRAWTATPAHLSATFDLAQTVLTAYEIGRSGNPLADWRAQYSAWYDGAQVSPVLAYDESGAVAFLNGIAAEVYRPAVEASLVANGTQVTTTPGQVGRRLDVLATVADLRPQIFSLGGAEIPLRFIETVPLVLDASAQAAAAQAILSQPLQLVIAEPLEGDPGPWVIDQAGLGAMLQVRRVEDGPNAAHFEVGLDPAALRTFLEPLAEPLTREARNARFIFNDDTRQLEVIHPSAPERRLDVEATIAAINAELANGRHSVPLVFVTAEPEVTEAHTAADLGITELVSEQSTFFAGSSAERVKNIRVASARFHGLLIPPNGTFSFVEHLGDVSLDSGFAEALIIFGGRTIRGVGGGVCQVSTSVFRTAYFGGFPIVERWSHAYRVGYYERGAPGGWSGPGLDATVYAPLVDFKFQNDTPYWLLMEVYVNESAGRLTWKFYSTSDGRQVTVSAPEVRNVVPAPEPLYEEDPALAAGEIKQVDWAAEGADVAVYRTVTRGGVQINAGEPPLSTHYQPWRAIYHYGPGTEGMPPPSAEPTPTP